ncbi:MAG: tetratricopeptide repeat protein [Arenicella sp.]|jgi:tetratricopeptide (TPR) repeat protein|nr:tetratricopeptide repeat protein [Arenicella sp.]
MLAGLPDSLFAQTASNASLPLSQAQLQQLGEEFSRAHRLQDQGDERAALAIYQKINQAQPKLVEPYINMAAIFTSNGELDKAQQILVRGLESDPASALLFTGLQKVYGAQASHSYAQALGTKSKVESRFELAIVDSLAMSVNLIDNSPSQEISVAADDNEAVVAKLEQRLVIAQTQLEQASSQLDEKNRELELAQTALANSQQAREQLLSSYVFEEQANNSELVISEIETSRPVAAEPVVTPTVDLNTVMIARVRSWASAWSDQNVAAYLRHYADDYSAQGSSRANWVEQRRQRLTQRSFISIEVSDFRVAEADDNLIKVSFKQRYRSDSFDDTIRKQLTFKKNSNALEQSKIVAETIVSS